MPTYGITPTGFVKPTLADIKAQQEAVWRSIWGADFDLSPETLPGHFIAVSADRELDLWEAMEALWSQIGPEVATGVTQDNLYALNALTRLPATKSIVTVDADGDPFTVVPAGTKFAVLGSPDKEFEVVEDTALSALGVASILCAAINPGPVDAPAGTVSVIVTPVSGLTSVLNADPAILGTNAETDEEFRIRRRDRMVTSVSSTLGAMRRALFAVNDVNPVTLIESVHVIENDSMYPIGLLPPKSVMAVPYYEGAPIDSMEEMIAQAIFQSKPAGIQLVGDRSRVITDDNGAPYTVRWRYPFAVPIFMTIDIGLKSGTLTPTQVSALKDYLVELGAAMNPGENLLVYGKKSISAWLNEWTGADIDDYTIKVGRTAFPSTDDPVVIDDGTGGKVEKADFSTANIDINPI